jgi:hypothetical protein
MAGTALGINNPNSRWNREQRRPHFAALPLLHEAEIDNLEKLIRAIENLRAFKYTTGNMPEARLHAIRLGTVRSELRQLKAGK